MAAAAAGSVRSLWRYPVKSMLGEELDSCDVTERGFVGDRAYALVDDEDGKVASAKNPRKWAKLFECRARFSDDGGEVRITLPGGATVSARDPEAAELLSGLLGRKTTLRTSAAGPPVIEELWLDGAPDGRAVTDEIIARGSPAGTFFDYSVVHLVTTGTLARLSELSPAGRFDVRRFRPNLVVSTADGAAEFVENAWVGRTVTIGGSVRLAVTDPCPRCVMATLAQEDLPADPGILRTAARHNSVVGGEGRGPQGAYAASVGVYARVLAAGTVRRGDPVRIL
ncbi:MAG TPA: MOSC N-terminal beta barrel domain-containing protein [Thermoanaerobaculia bacterium]